jgi:hypothetical protein
MVVAILEQSIEAGDDPVTSFADGLSVYLDTLANEMAFARLFLIEAYAAGDEVQRRRQKVQARVEQLMVERLGATTATEEFACAALVAAVVGLVTNRVAARDADGVRALHQPLVELVRAATAGRQR